MKTEPHWGWLIGWIVLTFATALCAGVIMFKFTSTAFSHDWYTNRTDPVTNVRCCGGTDCNTIPLEWMENGAVAETPDGYAINLTADQVRMINFAYTGDKPIQDFIPWNRVQMSSDDGSADKLKMTKSGFALCIWGGKVACFFRPPGNASLARERNRLT